MSAQPFTKPPFFSSITDSRRSAKRVQKEMRYEGAPSSDAGEGALNEEQREAGHALALARADGGGEVIYR